MESVLAGLQWDICLIYLDDIVVYAKTFEDMNRNLKFFNRLAAAGLKLKAKKCNLFAESVDYLCQRKVYLQIQRRQKTYDIGLSHEMSLSSDPF